MLSNTFAPASARRRGIVLILVLATLALMAVIGVTFATFTGQGKIGARSFAQSVLAPRPDDLMDFALQQLIADTGDVRSALRGHSLARDMYGNDAANNGYLTSRPDGAPKPPGTDPFFYVTGVSQVGTSTQYNLTTNIPVGDPAFYGYNFTRWTMRLTFIGAPTAPGTGVVDQTLEILADTSPGAYRVFTVDMAPTDKATVLSTSTPDPWPNLPLFPNGYPNGHYTQLPGSYLANGTGTFRFILDGRRLRAFNGPGMGAVVSSITNVPNSYYGNFRYNAALNPNIPNYGPNTVGMDEDYDACDLENWFLAIQSADGQVIIPSFHRPGILRYDPKNGVNDWARTNPAGNWADSAARILRPVAADGHDLATFPDLVPDPATGKITFDVDNDADGVTDSVWLDLGYPAHPDSSGRLSKPLFAFLVIGLNGRIPLNTAGNLAGQVVGIPVPPPPATPMYSYGGGATHAAHLGNSVSELDPTYALQNANQGPAIDADPFIIAGFGMHPYTSNTQVDNAGIDVRLTQLRNLLAGTRPQPTPGVPGLKAGVLSPVNGDNNFVLIGGILYYMPNNVADPNDAVFGTDANGNPYVRRLNPPVAGRWGEADSVSGGIDAPNAPNQINGYVNLVQDSFTNPVRAGYSFGIADLLNGAPRAAADDNYNQFDPFPIGHTGEVNDRDFFDSAGGLMLPVDRMRRFVTPVDIDGSGRALRWGVPWHAGDVGAADVGADAFGRVDFAGYFRPPGAPGLISVAPDGGVAPGTIVYPSAHDLFYTSGPNPANLTFPLYLPDVTNNPLHGFEAAKNPNLPGGYAPQDNGGMPADENVAEGIPDAYPTYDLSIRTNGLNEADEMNLYVPNAQLDAPFGYGDLEWLYRQQDVDGGSLVSRLAQLAPVSFSNTIDGQRRRRLFALDSWEMNNFVWSNDNPVMANPNAPPATITPFANNATFAVGANAGFPYLGAAPGLSTPPLAHRDKKINLNYPLPVSNDPDELIRRKWISDTYQLLKWVLPPLAVDTPEELAQLSQFVINIIDFRDPDCTMTHWQNPDVLLVPGQPANPSGSPPTPATAPTLFLASSSPANAIPLDQYGMEYNPVALNEVLAFSYAYQGVGSPANRFFVELVNTLTQSAFAAPSQSPGGTNPPDPSILDLGGFQYTPGDPYSGGCWDLVFTDDTPNSRPDPYRGELVQGGQFYALIPLNKDSFTASPAGAAAGSSSNSGSDVTLVPLWAAAVPSPSVGNPAASPPTPPNFFYAFGNSPANPAVTWTPSLVQYLSPAADPFNGQATPKTWYPGVLPGVVADSGTSPPPSYPPKLPTLTAGSQKTKYYWVCLRRPANPFAPVTAANPMLVVDAMRFPYIYIDGTATGSTVNTVYSAQRFQPYRGGHAVPVAAGPPANGTAAQPPMLDARYGYTEQIAGPPGLSQTTYESTTHIYHTLGLVNDQAEPWDYFPFHDRDFTGVAELMLVPGCPPGLFTKQFAEFAPSRSNSGIFAQVRPQSAPPSTITPFDTAARPFWYDQVVSQPMLAHTFPYLVDKFFYTGASNAADTSGAKVGSQTGDGWFKMFEFFEVPGQMMGATGPVAQGTNFDWDRQDTKPGLLNLNLIIDEEVFFSVVGQQDANFNQQWLNFIQVPSIPLNGQAPIPQYGPPVPLVVTAIDGSGSPVYVYPITNQGVTGTDPILAALNQGGVVDSRIKAAFAQFLWLRHGGSGYLFGFGNGAVGQNSAVVPIIPAPAGYGSGIPAERPFRSLSFPDIDYTVMRPATLPPSKFTNPLWSTDATSYTDDPGVRNPYLYPGYPTQNAPTGSAAAGGTPVYPGAIPVRRLFQVPDADPDSNASESGDRFINNQEPTPPANLAPNSPPVPAPGALPPVTIGINGTPVPFAFNQGYPNLVWSIWPGNNFPANVTSVGLGQPSDDAREHPFWRIEMLQRVMNLTTVRTHQYAVWITVGFFEVKRRGDVAMIASADPRLAFDVLGPEIGRGGDQHLRYRGFFLVDRLKLDGFDPTSSSPWHSAVVYRQNLQ